MDEEPAEAPLKSPHEDGEPNMVRLSPHELAKKKRTVEAQLEMDRQNLQNIKDSMAKSNALCESMMTCINSFEGRLGRLQTRVLPIYENTVSLMKKQENLQAILKILASIVNFYDMADSAKIIKQGVHQFGDMEAYISRVDQVLAARDFFKAEKPNGYEFKNANELVIVGLEKVNELYRIRMRDACRQYTEEELQTLRDTSLPDARIETIAEAQCPVEARNVIQRIARWLVDGPHDDTGIAVYSKARSTIIERNLQAYRTRTSQAALPTPGIIKTKKGQDVKPRKYLKVGGGKDSKASSTPGTGPGRDEDAKSLDAMSVTSLAIDTNRGGKRQANTSYVPISMDDTMAYYNLYCRTFVQCLRVEKALIRDLIPESQQKDTFDKVLTTSLVNLVMDGEAVSQQARALLDDQSFRPLIVLLRCCQLMFDASPQCVVLFKGLSSDPASRVIDLRNFFVGALYKGMQEFADFIETVSSERPSNAMASLPKDGTVHEITSSTLSILQKMTDHHELIGRVIIKYNPNQYKDSISPLKKAASSFFMRILRGVNSTVELKGRGYEQETLQAVFKLNNYNYISKRCGPDTAIFKVVSDTWPAIQEEYNNMIDSQHKCYIRGFGKLTAFLTDLSLADRSHTEVPKVVKSAIKEKFKAVNSELEELQRVQQHYAIPDEALKANLIENNLEMVLPKYTAFIEQHTVVLTFKAPAKYLKYSSNECEKLLRSFFDQSA